MVSFGEFFFFANIDCGNRPDVK